MSDYRVLVVDYLDEDAETGKTQWYSWLIRTHDSDNIKGMLRKLAGLDEQTQLFTRILSVGDGPPMLCSNSECGRWDSQEKFFMDDNGEQAKCPHCGHWIYVEECDIGEM